MDFRILYDRVEEFGRRLSPEAEEVTLILQEGQLRVFDVRIQPFCDARWYDAVLLTVEKSDRDVLREFRDLETPVLIHEGRIHGSTLTSTPEDFHPSILENSCDILPLQDLLIRVRQTQYILEEFICAGGTCGALSFTAERSEEEVAPNPSEVGIREVRLVDPPGNTSSVVQR